MQRTVLSAARLGVFFGLVLFTFAHRLAARDVDFHRDVRPLLSRHCFKCHGPDDKARKGGLRLDLRDAALRGGDTGEPALVPQKPADSELLRRLSATDPNEVMPPPRSGSRLSAADQKILHDWIAHGAEYKPHWAYVRPQQAPLPAIRQSNWVRNPIDRFILAKMEAAGLAPSAEADKETLLRRVSLDLIGLPPSPRELADFLADTSPQAYETVVDRLLQSPHYGERWARRWLDLARYADTNGYEKDRPRSMWPYRDWVIQSLNADLPFDQFTIEQLAGDLLPQATLSQRIATGFHRNTMINEEGGIDPQEFRFHSLTDRVSTTGTTWLGMTLICAQCHTHKYDPVTIREYYQMLAFYNNSDEPVLDIAKPDIAAQRQALDQQAARLTASLAARFPVDPHTRWHTVRPLSVNSAAGSKTEILPDHSILSSGKGPAKESSVVVLQPEPGTFSAIRLEALSDSSLPESGPGRGADGRFVLTEISVSLTDPTKPDQARIIDLASAVANDETPNFPVHLALDGKEGTGWSVHSEKSARPEVCTATFTFKQSLTLTTGSKITVRLEQQQGQQLTLGKFRLSLGTETPDARSVAVRRQEHLDQEFATWETLSSAKAVRWEILRPVSAEANMPLLTVQPDQSILASSDQTKRDVYTIRYRSEAPRITAIRLEALPDPSLPRGGPGRVYYEGSFGDFFLSHLTLQANRQPVRFVRATHSYASGKNTAAAAIDDNPLSGWSTDGEQGRPHVAVFNLAEPLVGPVDLEFEMVFERYYAAGLGRFRFSATDSTQQVSASDVPVEIEKLLLTPAPQRTPAEQAQLRDQFLQTTPWLSAAHYEIREVLKQRPPFPTTLVMTERPAGETRTTHVHSRGEFLKREEAVQPGVPAFLPSLPGGQPVNRLAFARWLVDAANPLTPRVTMNRHWAALFGRGIVRTLEDFGFQGEAPSHPQLLDWLAVEFIKQGWSVKKMHRLMVTSATYRQSSRVTPELLAKDAPNLWLARAPRFRLEAELIRDSALRASGLLSDKIGGPSVFPPQPAGVSSEGAYGPLAWNVSTGPDRYRRGLYTFAKRTAPFAMFGTFDGPSGEACIARREISNTPLQALTLLNDTVFLEAAQALGRTLAARPGTDAERVTHLFRLCLNREPAAEEAAAALQFFTTQRQSWERRPEEAARIAGDGRDPAPVRAAWSLLARALFNVDEFVTRN